MNLETLRKIAGGRTEGKWFFDGQDVLSDSEEYLVALPNDLIAAKNGPFIAMAANHFDKMLDVVEAARRVLSNIPGPQNGLLNLHEALKALEEQK